MTSTTNLLTEDQIKQERLRSMASTFARANSTLTGYDVSVEVTATNMIASPAYSLQRAVYLNTPFIGSLDTTDDIVKVTGLNFHELSHVMFTPGPSTALIMTIRQKALFKYFNMLEDQRIESLMTALYPSMRPYFTMAILKYIASPNSHRALGTAHALTYGRKYLPTDIRNVLRDRWVSPENRDELEDIIDRFRCLNLNKRGLDVNAVVTLIQRYANLVNGHGHPPLDPHGHNQRDVTAQPGADTPTGEKQESSDATERAIERIEESKPEDEDEGDGGQGGDTDTDDDSDSDADGGDSDATDDTDDDDGEDGSGKGSDDGEDSDDAADADGGGKGGDSDEDGDSDSDSDSDGDSASESSDGGSGAGSHTSDQDIRDMAKQALDKALSNPEVIADAKRKEAAIKTSNGQVPALPDTGKQASLGKVQADYLFAQVGFKRELSKLWADFDPGWDSHKSSGRINLKRAMTGEPIDTVFDQWNEGKQDASSLEVVLLADISGSMRLQMDSLSQSMWVIKSAVESIGGSVTVINFHTQAETAYSKKEKALRNQYRVFSATGGTSPGGALNQARMIFHYSQMKHKILLVLTDGRWSPMSLDVNNKSMKDIAGAGITTGLVYLGMDTKYLSQSHMDTDHFQQNTRHYAQVFAGVNEAKGLVTFAKKIVLQAMQN